MTLFGIDPIYTYLHTSGSDIVPSLPSNQIVVTPLISVSETLFNPAVIPGSVTIDCQLISIPSVLFNPTVIQIIQSPVLTTSTTLFDPAVVPGPVSVVTPVVSVPTTLFNPTVVNADSVLIPIINSFSTIFEPSVVSLLQVINTQLIQASSAIFNPIVSGGSVGGSLVGSLMDRARVNMLTELILSEPQFFTNTDLMRQVIIDPGQTTITVTDASAANQLWRYLAVVRDS